MEKNLVQSVSGPTQAPETHFEFPRCRRGERLQRLGRPKCVGDQISCKAIRIVRTQSWILPGNDIDCVLLILPRNLHDVSQQPLGGMIHSSSRTLIFRNLRDDCSLPTGLCPFLRIGHTRKREATDNASKEPQGGWAANQMRATARKTLARSRWSLDFVKKLTIFEESNAELF